MVTCTEPARRRGAAVVLGAFLVAGTATGVGATAADASAHQLATPRLEAQLRPSGDPDGSGEALFRLSKVKHRICAAVEWHRIGAPMAAHIHRRSDGAVLVDLTGSVTGGAHCATGVSSALIGRILDHPRRYYFNVHNARYPAGAIRGTLHR